MEAHFSFLALREEYRTVRAEVRMFHVLSFFMSLASYAIFAWMVHDGGPSTTKAWMAFGSFMMLSTAVWSLREKLAIMPKIAKDIRAITGHATVMRHDAGEHNMAIRGIFDWTAFPLAFVADLVVIALAIF